MNKSALRPLPPEAYVLENLAERKEAVVLGRFWRVR